ncbi:MAG: hypothetical protein IKA64_02225, partial [Clostridia bacterium]|nr:hypothetical protein [Clostridia bacterium]
RMDLEDPTAPDASRIRVCMLRVLRTMKKEGSVQFFITPAELDSGSTEAEFLKNKYQATIDAWCGGGEYYVRI